MNDARFWSMVEKTSTCWLWTGSCDTAGYGQVRRNKRTFKSHRYAWELVHGQIPKDGFLLHSCNVKQCVNPSHLRIGTQKENASDNVLSGNAKWRKLSLEQIAEMCRLYDSGECTSKTALGKLFGVSNATAWWHVSGHSIGSRIARLGTL